MHTSMSTNTSIDELQGFKNENTEKLAKSPKEPSKTKHERAIIFELKRSNLTQNPILS